MKRYENYKPTGIQWLPEIPEHWNISKIKSHFRLRATKVSDNEYSALSVSKNGITPQLDSAVKTDNGDNRKLVKSGDFVVNSRSDRKGSCGISSLDGSVSLINIVLEPIDGFGLFYHHLFRSNNYIEEFYRNGRGIVSDLWTTRWNEMSSIEIPFPPIDEQKHIAAYLDKRITLIENCKCQRERELQTLNELKQAEIASVVTRGLNPDVPMKDSGQIQFGKVPAHWDTIKLKYCFNQRSEKGFPNEPVLCATQSKGVIPQSLYENRVVVVNKGFDGLKLVKVGDFVISLRSFQGGIEYAYYQGIISSAYTILTPKDERNSKYFKYLFKSHPFIQLLQTCVTGIREGQNINYSVLGNNFIPVPPIEEQNAIVEYIESKTSKIDTMIEALKAEIDRLTEYKQRLISDVVTGQIDVRGEQIQ